MLHSLIRNKITQLFQRDLRCAINSLSRLSSTTIPSAPNTEDEKGKNDNNLSSQVSNKSDVVTNTSGPSVPWKANVLEVPLAMTPQYIIDNYREHRNGGFYYDHRIIVPKFPEKYTVEIFDTIGTGGNHPDTGRKEYRRVGGGLKKKWVWVDTLRRGPTSGPPLVERVIRIQDSDCHTSKVALIGHGNTRRYILATENMKVGDLLRTSCEIPKNPVKASEGDAFPVGALPVGTMVNSIEDFPGRGAKYAINAGTYATIMKRIDNRCILQLPTKHEISIREDCMVTVGRLSNVDRNEFVYGKAGAKRLLGIRPKLGLFHPKTSRFGRRPFRPKPILVIDGEKQEFPNVIKLQHPDLDFYK